MRRPYRSIHDPWFVTWDLLVQDTRLGPQDILGRVGPGPTADPGLRAPLLVAGGGLAAGSCTSHPAFAGEVDSLLDAASYGSRWVALRPVPARRG